MCLIRSGCCLWSFLLLAIDGVLLGLVGPLKGSASKEWQRSGYEGHAGKIRTPINQF